MEDIQIKHVDFQGTEEEFLKSEQNRINIATTFGYCGVAGCKNNEVQAKTREGNIMVNCGMFGGPNGGSSSNFVRGLVCDEHWEHQDMIVVDFKV